MKAIKFLGNFWGEGKPAGKKNQNSQIVIDFTKKNHKKFSFCDFFREINCLEFFLEK